MRTAIEKSTEVTTVNASSGRGVERSPSSTAAGIKTPRAEAAHAANAQPDPAKPKLELAFGAELVAEQERAEPVSTASSRVQPAAVQHANAPASQAAPAKAPAIAPEDEHAMHTGVELIVARLEGSWLSDREKNEILALVETWSQRDVRRVAEYRDDATPYLDRFLFLLKIRTFVSSSISSAWQDQHLNAFDELWRALDGDGRFAALVARSRTQAVTGPQSGPAENFWKTLGKQEAMGLLGMVKGLVMGAVGLVDAGAGGITTILKSVPGLNRYVADNPKLAQWFAEQYDYIGRQAFGKEWDEKLVGGMSAADIGTEGGQLIWNLVMIGAGNRLGALGKGTAGVGTAAAQGATSAAAAAAKAAKAALWAQRALSALSIIGRLGSLQGVRDSVVGIASVIERLQKQDKLTVSNVLADQEFLQNAVGLIAAIYGAISGGGTSSQRWAASHAGVAFEIANALVAVKALIEAELSTDPTEIKTEKRWAAIGDLAAALYRAIAQLAGTHDAHIAARPATGTQATTGEAPPAPHPAAASPATASPTTTAAPQESAPVTATTPHEAAPAPTTVPPGTAPATTAAPQASTAPPATSAPVSASTTTSPSSQLGPVRAKIRRLVGNTGQGGADKIPSIVRTTFPTKQKSALGRTGEKEVTGIYNENPAIKLKVESGGANTSGVAKVVYEVERVQAQAPSNKKETAAMRRGARDEGLITPGNDAGHGIARSIVEFEDIANYMDENPHFNRQLKNQAEAKVRDYLARTDRRVECRLIIESEVGTGTGNPEVVGTTLKLVRLSDGTAVVDIHIDAIAGKVTDNSPPNP